MRNFRTIVALIVLGSASAAAANSYEGKWQASSDGAGKACPGFTANIIVTGNKVTLGIGSSYNTRTMKGAVAADGSFTASAGTATAEGKFSGETR